MHRVEIDSDKTGLVAEVVGAMDIPVQDESATHSFSWNGKPTDLANAYLAIVAICHQTSPPGERQLEGYIGSARKRGWDYLKEKFLLRAVQDGRWASRDFWIVLTPGDLSALYEDASLGKSLNRITERTFLLNDLGSMLRQRGFTRIEEAFAACGRAALDGGGFLQFLKQFEAYKDPVCKKSLFFLSVAASECGWRILDGDKLRCPVDYHELRGHLRLGTVRVGDANLAFKLKTGLPFAEADDTKLRGVVQEIDDIIVRRASISSSALHYFLWNVFRCCCPRDSALTHCAGSQSCTLPDPYKGLLSPHESCVFSEVCASAKETHKPAEPPYIGHFY